MPSLRNLAFGVWLILLTLPGLASSAGPEIPSPQGEVTDLVGILDGGTRQELTRLIQGVRDRSMAEIAILIIPTTAPETIEDYSLAVFDRWKIGQRGKDNGLLFLVAIQDRRLHITTGYGLEGILPDGKVGEIRDREIVPLFRAGHYAEGILRGTQALASVIAGQPTEGGSARQPGARIVRRQGRVGSRYTGILLGIFILLMLFVMALSAKDRPNALTGRSRARRSFWGPWWMGGGFGGGMGGWSGGGGSWSGGGFSSGSFGGFGGGSTGGGGAGGSW